MKLQKPKIKKCLKRLQVGTLAIFLLCLTAGCGLKQKPLPAIDELVVWGVWDDSDVIDGFAENYIDQNPNIKQITYRKFPIEEYEDELIRAFARDQGPDIFLAHHTWLKRHGEFMIGLEQSRQVYNQAIQSLGGCQKPPSIEQPLISERNYKEAFVDVAYQDFVSNGEIYGIPLAVDTLALYYNEDLYKEINEFYPPTTWEELEKISRKLAKIDEFGNINQAGIGMGTARNVGRPGDILAMLIMQKGSDIVDRKTLSVEITQKARGPAGQLINPGLQALEFYTGFADASHPNYTWNPRMHHSTDLFQEGKLGMIINYTFAVDLLKLKAPKLNFKLAKIPQFQGASPENKITYANYWGYVVAGKSAHKRASLPIEAWKFLLYLGQKEQIQAYVELTNRPPSRRDVIEERKNDPDFGVFAEQAYKAKSWIQPNEHRVNQIFKKNIEDVALNKQEPEDAVNNIESNIQVLIEKNFNR
ncbi:MAG: extracellular solute-binding protein [Candidatus Moranbacteria bacterium]|nr:extracellular solute-binding protein [Candidatus Moranbacteria bacterium]